jgi:hypothetical protein
LGAFAKVRLLAGLTMPFSVTVPDLKKVAMVEAGREQAFVDGSAGTSTGGLQEANTHARRAIHSHPAPVLRRRGFFIERLFWSVSNVSLFSRAGNGIYTHFR